MIKMSNDIEWLKRMAAEEEKTGGIVSVGGLVNEVSAQNWKPFWFEGNEAWGQINNAEDWKRIKDAYKDSGISLSTARICTTSLASDRMPNFGFYSEHSGELTLGEFARQNTFLI